MNRPYIQSVIGGAYPTFCVLHFEICIQRKKGQPRGLSLRMGTGETRPAFCILHFAFKTYHPPVFSDFRAIRESPLQYYWVRVKPVLNSAFCTVHFAFKTFHLPETNTIGHRRSLSETLHFALCILHLKHIVRPFLLIFGRFVNRPYIQSVIGGAYPKLFTLHSSLFT